MIAHSVNFMIASWCTVNSCHLAPADHFPFDLLSIYYFKCSLFASIITPKGNNLHLEAL